MANTARFRSVLLGASLLFGSPAAWAGTIVIPGTQATQAGNYSLGAGTVDNRIQEIVGSGIAASPIWITGLSFRAAPGQGNVSFDFTTFDVTASTSGYYPNSNSGHQLLSSTFADNVGPDATVVYDSSLVGTLPGCSGPAACPFGATVWFSTPFLYNPSQGRLLLDFSIAGTSSGNLDFETFPYSSPNYGDGVAMDFGGLTDTSGTVVGNVNSQSVVGALILQLDYTPAPEPCSWALLLSGAAALACLRRRT